jgi:hypothetical protein
VLQGVLEGTTTATVNLVNADLLAKNRGLKWVWEGMGGRRMCCRVRFCLILGEWLLYHQAPVVNSLPCEAWHLIPSFLPFRLRLSHRISEVTVRGEGSDVLTSMSVALASNKSKFSGAVDKTGRIYIEGQVRNGTPFITKIGGFDVELSVQVRRSGWSVVGQGQTHPLLCVVKDVAKQGRHRAQW